MRIDPEKYKLVKTGTYKDRPAYFYRSTLPVQCPNPDCRHRNRVTVDEKNHERAVYDIDDNGEFVYRVVERPKLRCLSCKKKFFPKYEAFEDRYSPEFRRRLAEELSYSKENIAGLSKKYQLSNRTFTVLVEDYIGGKEKEYHMPRYLGIEPVAYGAGTAYLIFDIWNMKVLDVLTRGGLEERPDRGRVQEIYTRDIGAFSGVSDLFPDAVILLDSENIKKPLIDAVFEDTKKLAIGRQEVDFERLVYDLDQNEFRQAAAYDSEILPMFLNLKRIAASEDILGDETDFSGRHTENLEKQFSALEDALYERPVSYDGKLPERAYKAYKEKSGKFLEKVLEISEFQRKNLSDRLRTARLIEMDPNYHEPQRINIGGRKELLESSGINLK